MTTIPVIFFTAIMLVASILCIATLNGEKQSDIHWMQGCCFFAFLIIAFNIMFAGFIFKQQYDQGQIDALNGKQTFRKVMVEQIQMIEKKK